MKAKPQDYSEFEKWLSRRRTQGGDGKKILSREHREESADIYDAFLKAKAGILGLKCACGQDGFDVVTIQPASTWPAEKHVVCESHAKLMNEVEAFFKQIVGERK